MHILLYVNVIFVGFLYSRSDFDPKREKEDLDTLSEWVKSVRSLIQIRIKKLSGSTSLYINL
jgi:hypothetical protein